MVEEEKAFDSLSYLGGKSKDSAFLAPYLVTTRSARTGGVNHSLLRRGWEY